MENNQKSWRSRGGCLWLIILLTIATISMYFFQQSIVSALR